jgi:CarD family transcriptional regulator
MAREVAAIERIDRDAAIAMLNKSLVKAPAAAAA